MIQGLSPFHPTFSLILLLRCRRDFVIHPYVSASLDDRDITIFDVERQIIM